MGVVFRKYGISFAEIISSPMFRTVETAEMAAGKPKTTMALRVIPSTPEQEALIKTAPKPGTNRLLVTHHFVIEKHVPGVKPGGVGESEAAVVSHAADGTIQLVGIIKLDDWKALANPGSESRQPRPGRGRGHGAPAAAEAQRPSRCHSTQPWETRAGLRRGLQLGRREYDAQVRRVVVDRESRTLDRRAVEIVLETLRGPRPVVTGERR
jgi:hypothetical protein